MANAIMNKAHLTAPRLPAPSVMVLKTRRAAPAVLVLLSTSLMILLAPPTSAYEGPTKAPDLTDYVSMYKDAMENVWDNEKAIKEYKKELEDKSKLPDEISSIKKRIGDKVLENKLLWERIDEIQRLNIESYKLDKRTQKIFDEAEDTIRDNFLGVNGVNEVYPDNKHRKIIVVVDPDDFASSNYTRGIDAFIDEIQKSADVDVEVQVEKTIPISSIGCPGIANQCQQIKDRKCNNPDHLLVIRESLQLACVSGEFASRLGWPEVKFSENDDMTVSYTPLEVKVGGEKFQINATLKNGLIEKAWSDDQLDGFSLKINSVNEGGIRLEIPESFFAVPEGTIHDNIIVLENGEEIHSDARFEQGRYVVEFSFSDTDPKIEVIATYFV